jgi:hypothetical protein
MGDSLLGSALRLPFDRCLNCPSPRVDWPAGWSRVPTPSCGGSGPTSAVAPEVALRVLDILYSVCSMNWTADRETSGPSPDVSRSFTWGSRAKRPPACPGPSHLCQLSILMQLQLETRSSTHESGVSSWQRKSSGHSPANITLGVPAQREAPPQYLVAK